MKKILYIFSICFSGIFPFVLNAQDVSNSGIPLNLTPKITENNTFYTIRGTVIDSMTTEPIPLTTLILLEKLTNKLIKGVVSNYNGDFEIKINSRGNYLLVVQILGYKTIQLDIKFSESQFFDLGKIQLQTSSIQLHEVIVKPLIEETTTEIIYNISSDPDRAKMSVHDIMQKIPLINIQPDGSFYVESPEKKVLFVRNGRKDAILSGNLPQVLKALPALGFSKLKIMLEPPKRYEDVDYVINIVTDQSVKVIGAIGNLTGNYGNETNSYSFVPSTTFSSEKLRGRISPGYGHSQSLSKKSKTEQLFHSENRKLIMDDISNLRSNTKSISSTFSYDLTKSQYFNLNLSLNGSNNSYVTENQFNQWVNEVLQKQYFKTGKIGANGKGVSINTDYEYNFKIPDRILHIGYMINSSGNTSEESIFLNGYLNSTTEKGLSEKQVQSVENKFQFDYSDYSNKKISLEAGIGILYRKYLVETNHFSQSNSLMEWIADSSLYRLMDKKYFIVNSYLSLTYVISKKVSLNGALKAEYLDDGKGSLIKEGFIKRHITEKGLTINPIVGMNILIGKKRYGIKYIARQERPSLNHLDPYINDPKSEIIIVGNPDLKPQIRHNFNLTSSIIRKNPVSLNLFGSFTNNFISNYWFISDKGQTVSTYANYGKNRMYGLSTNTRLTLMKKYFFPTSASFYFSTLEKPGSEKTETYNLQIGISHNHSFKNNFSLSLSSFYFKFWNKGFNYVELPPFTLRCSLQKSMLKQKLRMELNASNLLWQRVKSTRYVNTSLFNTIVTNNRLNYPFYFNATFNFGKFKVKPVKVTKKTTVIDDILKSE